MVCSTYMTNIEVPVRASKELKPQDQPSFPLRQSRSCPRPLQVRTTKEPIAPIRVHVAYYLRSGKWYQW